MKFKEFDFSGTPNRPHKVSICLDEVLSFNEVSSGDGFYNKRTRVKLKKYTESQIHDGHGYILDIPYNEFKSIMTEYENTTRNI